jgi:cysteine desulfuration protein SufE
MTDITQSPFGTEITPEEILDTLGFFDDWEERLDKEWNTTQRA